MEMITEIQAEQNLCARTPGYPAELLETLKCRAALATKYLDDLQALKRRHTEYRAMINEMNSDFFIGYLDPLKQSKADSGHTLFHLFQNMFNQCTKVNQQNNPAKVSTMSSVSKVSNRMINTYMVTLCDALCSARRREKIYSRKLTHWLVCQRAVRQHCQQRKRNSLNRLSRLKEKQKVCPNIHIYIYLLLSELSNVLS
jgi:hypothetical protein